MRGTGAVEVEEEGWVRAVLRQRGEGAELERPGVGVCVQGVFGGENLGEERRAWRWGIFVGGSGGGGW